MRAIIDQLGHARTPAQMARRDRALVRAGLQWHGPALLMTAQLPLVTHLPQGLDRWATERWVNKILLDSVRDPQDPLWRLEMTRDALVLASALLALAVPMTSLPVQVLICLQSAPGEADPEIDHSTGALFLTQVASPDEDITPEPDASQPVLALTRRGGAR